ncbi:MAG: VWA domain-containing protein [Bacteroidales bacterium]|nr:VWA domain-containing protein [Bacteroidales bacterium]
MFTDYTYANPGYLYLLILLPLLGAWYWYKLRNNNPGLQFSSTSGFSNTRRSWRQYFIHSLFIFRILAIGLLIIVLARPQSTTSRRDVNIEGIDIVLTMDVSGSMLAQDLRPDRLEASKNVAAEFIAGRPDDRIGLVIFSGESFTQSPLTSDHSMITNLFKDIKSGMIEDGTAIGDGLATSINRLKESKAISKVIILITDGENNRGSIDPLSAAEIARMYGIRIYTIGAGTIGVAPYPVQTPYGIQYQNMEVKIDEKSLREIAKTTDGKYFRATSNKKLKEIYEEIDQLEKSKIDVTEFSRKHEEFLPFALLALILIIIEIILRNTIFRSIP